MVRLLVCLLFVNIVCAAESPAWLEGCVVLRDGKVYVGDIVVDAYHHIVLLKQGQGAKVYAAHELKQIHVHDAKRGVNRVFIARADDAYLRSWNIFEVVVEGSVSCSTARR